MVAIMVEGVVAEDKFYERVKKIFWCVYIICAI